MSYSLDGIPADLMTSQRVGTRRLRVDVAETGFFEAREFRISEELSIPAGATRVYRFTSPIDFILQSQVLSVDTGAIRFRAYRASQGVESGAWTPVPTYGMNIMEEAPDYTMQSSIDTGGVFTPNGGEVSVETIRVRTSGATAQRSTVTASAGDQRGLSAGTYYLMLSNIDTGGATGVFDLKWEERPTS